MNMFSYDSCHLCILFGQMSPSLLTIFYTNCVFLLLTQLSVLSVLNIPVLVKYVVCKYFLAVSSLSFNSLNTIEILQKKIKK